MTPSWSSLRTAPSRRRAAGSPEGKESLRYDHRLPVARSPDRHGAPSSDAAATPVLLDFHAEWCGPCRQVRPAVEELIRNRYPVKSIDIDKDPGVATRYGVDRVPTFVVVDASGRELDRTSGPQSSTALARFYLAAKAKAQPPDNSTPMPALATIPDRTVTAM